MLAGMSLSTSENGISLMKSFEIVYPKKTNPKSLVHRFVTCESVEEAIRTIYPYSQKIVWKRKSVDFTYDEYLVDNVLVMVYGEKNVN